MAHCIGDIINQRYKILSVLGEGGTGITYSAQDQTNHQTVAIKTLSLRQAEDWKVLELFEREAQTLAQLKHPNIPTYLDYFAVENDRDRFFYIVQEQAQGKSLFQWVQEDWRCTEKEVKAIALQVLNILDYLHSFSTPVIHRDIKPHNLIRRADGQIFLVDFGSVGSTYHNTFMRGSTVVGTFGYMAPEQFRGQAVPATDFYGLGATMLFLLTRRSPAELPTQKLKVEFRSRIQISDVLADWIEKALEPSAKDRFESVDEALRGLSHKMVTPYQIPRGLIFLLLISLILSIFLPILNRHKYYVLNKLDLTIFTANNISRNRTNIEDYLSSGGDPNAKSNGLPLIHTAIRSGEIGNVKALVKIGVNLQATDKQGTNILHEAVSISYIKGDRRILEYLLSLNKVDLSTKNKDGKTPLDYLETQNPQYAYSAAEAILNYLIQNKSQKKDQAKSIDKLVKICFQNNWLSMLVNLKLNLKNNEKDLLHKITKKLLQNQDVGAINILIDREKEYSKKFFSGERYDQLLAFIKPEDFLKLFSDINHVDTKGNTFINSISQKFISMEEVEKIKALIKLGANLNQSNLDGKPPLVSILTSEQAITNRLEEAIIALVNGGANPNFYIPFKHSTSVSNISLKTPLHITSAHYNSRIVEVLLQHHANPNSIDAEGNTPLHEAVFNRDLNVAKLLIKAGAKFQKNKEGNTPLDLITYQYANPDVSQFLKDYSTTSEID
jgi:serine/threonine protein kinase